MSTTLNTHLNKSLYKSNDIYHGKLVSAFFDELTNHIFEKSWLFYKAHKEKTGNPYLPLLNNEKMLYSIVAAALDQLTPMHLSEIPFNRSETNLENSRIVDFWCLTNPETKTAQAISYYIELKQAYYCTSEGTKEEPTQNFMATLEGLFNQVRNIKTEIKPDRDNVAYLGLMIVPGYHNSAKEAFYDEQAILNSIDLDSRSGVQIIANTWRLPTEIETQYEYFYSFITIIGLVLTTKK